MALDGNQGKGRATSGPFPFAVPDARILIFKNLKLN